MAKLSKPQIKAHNEAVERLKKDRLTTDDHDFVFDHWMESANHINSAAGAFFTPREMSWTFALEVGGSRVLDLCAGIGVLAYAVYHRSLWGSEPPCELTCVEINPDYLAVGLKVLPEARWIEADALADLDIGRFDWVISNPPFGRLQGHSAFDLAIVERAERYADDGTFILPAGSVPWSFSGHQCFDDKRPSDLARSFRERTKIDLKPNCGIDCSYWQKDWRGAAPKVEIALADYAEARALRAAEEEQPDLFGRAAA